MMKTSRSVRAGQAGRDGHAVQALGGAAVVAQHLRPHRRRDPPVQPQPGRVAVGLEVGGVEAKLALDELRH